MDPYCNWGSTARVGAEVGEIGEGEGERVRLGGWQFFFG